MRVSELFWKVVTFGLVAAVMVLFGVVVLLNAHPGIGINDIVLGVALIFIGVVTGIFGAVTIAASIAEHRAQQREAALHVTPRSGPPTAPPPWGMGDVGRPGVIRVDRMIGAQPQGRGGIKIVGLPMRHLDVPIVVGLLITWTVIACLVWTTYAPQH